MAISQTGEPNRLFNMSTLQDVIKWIKTIVDWRIPTGAIIQVHEAFPMDSQNWLECDGSAITEKKYPRLYTPLAGTLPDYTADALADAKVYIKT